MQTFFKTLLIICFISNSFSFSHSKDPVRAKNGMVVSISGLASDIGLEILKKGGNAVDAAVAVAFALAVVHPAAGNLGGGGFMLIHFEDGKNTSIDFRETAPESAFAEMFVKDDGNVDETLIQESGAAAGVPGSPAGLIYALRNYGTMSLEDVLNPAINIAEEGFNISWQLANSFNYNNQKFNTYPSSKKIFTKDGKKFEEGDLFIQKDLAETLKRIRDFGVKGFYEGKTAQLIINQINQFGDYMSLDDLANYSPKEREVVIGDYHDYKIISMGPPSSGGIALIQSLNILEKFSLSKADFGSSKYIHYLTETLKHVYADRSKHLGDSDFYDVPIENLISKNYGTKIADKISGEAIESSNVYPGEFSIVESSETTHFSVIDSYGNAVGVTTTINSSYGNKIVVEGAGFLLNNEMDDFSAKPGVPNQFGLVGSEANSIQPNKRMLSSMTPTIVLRDNEPFIITGAAGGSTIITTVLQIILNVIEFNMDIQEAMDAPRFHHQWLPDRLDYEEYGLSLDVKTNLSNRGHKIGVSRILGRAHSILVDENRIFWGAPDPRGFGKASGY